MRSFLISLSVAVLAAGCNNTTVVKGSSDSKDTAEAHKADALATNMDMAADPSIDFFQYANGGWIARNPIPGDQGGWGIGNLVIEENLNRLRTICEKADSTHGASGSIEQKIGDFWATAMDSARIQQQGLQGLQPWLNAVDTLNSVPGLIQLAGKLKTIGSSNLFSEYVTQDDKNSEVMVLRLNQGGLGLPEKTYYFKKDSATEAIRQGYLNYITKMLTLAGSDSNSARRSANDVVALETKLAMASRSLEALRDPYKNYNKMAASDLGRLAPSIDWTSFFDAYQVNGVDSVVVGQPEFFKALNGVLASTPMATWRAELRFQLLADFANYLPEPYGLAAFEFSRMFSGAKERRPRWKRVIQAEETVLGQPMGHLYVKEFFSEKAKQRYSDMVEAIRTALHDRISQLAWMSDSTKQKAYIKLAAIRKKVGYPDKWRDFSAMEIGRDSYVANAINANKWWHQYNVNKLGKPVDRDEWDMDPQTYNAYYNPSNNEIVLPAGIFTVPGYRDEELDDATVYGYAAASTIGHEITHGFDDEGRQFDEKGNLKSWWTKKDEAEFNKRADVMIKQFDAYEPIKGYHINGKATLGENIADLGGILLGLEAFKKTDQYKRGDKIAGFTPLQRYFLGYSLGWLGQSSAARLRSALLTDVHSPAKYRVNGPFADVDEFYSAFNIRPGAPMYRADSLRVRIW